MPEELPKPEKFNNAPKTTTWKRKREVHVSNPELSLLNKFGFGMSHVYQSKLKSLHLKTKDGTPHKESELLIMWMKMILKDKRTFKRIVKELIKDTEKVLDSANKDLIIHLLEKRFINGSIKHGKPESDQSRIAKEIMTEQLDLLGWKLISMFSKEKLHQ